MRPLVPPFILEQAARGQTGGSFDAACLFVDTSGFTPLTSALMAHGTEGAEVIAAALTAIFEPLVGIVHQHGGFAAAFAGDACKAIFPADQPDAPARALAAAQAIRAGIAATLHTPFGAFPFAVKILAARGQVDWGIWQGGEGEQRRAALFEGGALAQCLEADPFAAPGEIVLTRQLWADLPAGLGTVSPAGEYLRLESFRAPSFDPPPPLPAAPPQPEAGFFPRALHEMTTQGEFRVVTTVFINLQTLPADRAFHAEFFRLLAQYGGYLCRIGRIGERDRGGTLLLFWGAPTRREHDAERALGFLLDLQAASPTPLRAGVTTHMAYAGFVGAAQRAEYTCYGSHVNLAARQMVAADWGEIWLDGETARLARHVFHVPEKGRYPMKGFAEPRQVFLLHGRRAVTGTALHRWELAGRGTELAQLRAALQPIFEGRFGGIITIRGEAGIGKSRLVYELQAQTSEVSFATCQADDILRQSLNPFRYWLARYFSQSSEAGEAVNRAAFDDRLAALLDTREPALAAELERTRSFLAALVNLHTPGSLHDQLDPKGRFANTLSALKTLVKAESLRQPLVLVIEDAHWLDADSREFLGMLTRNVEAYPFVVLATARPEGEPIPGDDSSPQGSATPAKVFDLGQLSREGLAGLAAGILGSPPSASVLDLLEQRAEGNPFFAEQILLYLQAGEALPDDVRAVLVARIDRLAQGVKEVVQAAAVLGREFELRLLGAVLRGQEVAGEVATAEQAEIWSALAELRYLFKHALLRDAAYEMQLAARRRELHRVAGEALERLYAARLEARYGELAYHFEKAGELPRAVFYLVRAGEQAQANYQNEAALDLKGRAVGLIESPAGTDAREGIEGLLRMGTGEAALALQLERAQLHQHMGQLDQADEVVGRLFQDERLREYADLQARAAAQLGDVSEMRGEYDVALTYLLRALEIYRLNGNQQGEANLLSEIGFIHFRKSDYPAAGSYYEEALKLADTLGDAEGVAKNLTHIGTLLSATARVDEAEAYFLQARESYARIGKPVRVSVITSNLGTNFFRKGDYLQARQFYEQALAMDRQLGQFNGIGTNLGGIGITYYNQADYEKCVFYCEQALEIAREMGAQADMARHLGNMAASHQMLGNWLEAEEYFKAAIEMRRKIGLTANLAQLLGNFAHFLSRYGKHEGALSAIDEALLIIENIPHSFFHIQVFFYEGEVSFLAGDFARAKKAFEKYLELSNPEYGAERIFEVGLRLQKIQFKLASGDEARRRVEGMLPKAITPRQQALTHLELWRMGAGEAHREAAIALITELFGKTKDVEYREYLEELGADPAG